MRMKLYQSKYLSFLFYLLLTFFILLTFECQTLRVHYKFVRCLLLRPLRRDARETKNRFDGNILVDLLHVINQQRDVGVALWHIR